MSEVQSHRDLVVWQRAMDLTVEVYRLSAGLPTSRDVRHVEPNDPRSVLCAGEHRRGVMGGRAREFANFLFIARGSLAELDTFLELGRRLGYFPAEDVVAVKGLADEVGNMTTSLRRSLASR